MKRDSRVGAVLREQNALPHRVCITIYSTAKDAIDNGGAGRAAKSANPSSCYISRGERGHFGDSQNPSFSKKPRQSPRIRWLFSFVCVILYL